MLQAFCGFGLSRPGLDATAESGVDEPGRDAVDEPRGGARLGDEDNCALDGRLRMPPRLTADLVLGGMAGATAVEAGWVSVGAG